MEPYTLEDLQAFHEDEPGDPVYLSELTKEMKRLGMIHVPDDTEEWLPAEEQVEQFERETGILRHSMSEDDFISLVDSYYNG